MNAETLRKGKKGELYVIRELVSRGTDVYLPVLDIGVDAVVSGKAGQYSEIQIKATEKDEQAGYFNVHDIAALARPNYFVVCIDMNEKKLSKKVSQTSGLFPPKISSNTLKPDKRERPSMAIG